MCLKEGAALSAEPKHVLVVALLEELAEGYTANPLRPEPR